MTLEIKWSQWHDYQTFSSVTSIMSMSALARSTQVISIGVNWGNQMTHPIEPDLVVAMLKANRIRKVKLFDADYWTMSALSGSGIEVMAGIPNDQLKPMSNYEHANGWVLANITPFVKDGGVNITYIAVGNEPFRKTNRGMYLQTIFPAMKNVQRALDEAGHRNIKVTCPFHADVYLPTATSKKPSSGVFRSDINDTMVEIVRFLRDHDSAYVVNINPFVSLYQNPDFPFEFALFDGGSLTIHDNISSKNYTNVFDVTFDTLVWALRKAGAPNLKIIVGEVGWPTDGNINANPDYAEVFYDGFLNKMAKKEGTPLRPGPIDAYLYGLIDENLKSILTGDFERHWGILRYDGQPKFRMDLSELRIDMYQLKGVNGVEYLPLQWCVFNKKAKDLSALNTYFDQACINSDCTALNYGSSCNNLNAEGNISYAFNMFFQMSDQDVKACHFGGLGKIAYRNATQYECLFPVQIISTGSRTTVVVARTLLLFCLVVLFFCERF